MFWIIMWNCNVNFQNDRDSIVLSEKNHESLEAASYYNGQPRRNNFWVLEFQASCFTTIKILTKIFKKINSSWQFAVLPKSLTKYLSPYFCQLKTYPYNVSHYSLNCMMIWFDPSLNTQFCIKGLLVVRDFCFWAIWV